MDITYDRFGRMKYNSEFHINTGKAWNTNDKQYLIDWYDIIGPEEMSFALERTIVSVMQKVNVLRQNGVMKKPLKRVNSKRIKKDPLARAQY